MTMKDAPRTGDLPDPLERLAQALGRCERRHNVVDMRPGAERQNTDDYELQMLDELRGVIVTQVTFERAASAIGAMIQLAAAKSRLDDLAEVAAMTDDREAERLRRAVDRVLYSIADWIERDFKIERRAYGVSSFLSAETDIVPAIFDRIATA